MSKLMLNLGCGGTRPQGWVNIDSSLNALLQTLPLGKFITQKIFNSVTYESANVTYMELNKKKWKYDTNSVDIVYASHFLEHLSLSAAEFLLEESFRTLKKGGVIRIVVPDLYQNAKNYVNSLDSGNLDAYKDFMYILNLHKEQAYGSHTNLLAKFVNWFQDYPHQHKFMYDKYCLTKLLEKQGFSQIKYSQYATSNYIDNIKEVEYTSEGIAAIYVEALK